ncbi:MAG: hypothetical protein IJT59_04915, partial [Desulfovibrionaceae bacterium]|nr:hypothetical protein [Desulfovibrionaceae bacterium]
MAASTPKAKYGIFSLKKGETYKVPGTSENNKAILSGGKASAVINLDDKELKLTGIETLQGTSGADKFVIKKFYKSADSESNILNIYGMGGKNTFDTTSWEKESDDQTLALYGGNSVDTFTINKDQTLTIDGGASSDKIFLKDVTSASSEDISGDVSDDPNYTTLGGDAGLTLKNVETVEGVAGADSLAINSFEGKTLTVDLKNGENYFDTSAWTRDGTQTLNLKGGASTDTFAIAHGQTLNIDGGKGNDKVVLKVANDLSGNDSDGDTNITIASNATNLVNIETLEGLADTDDFITIKNFTGNNLLVDGVAGADTIDTSSWTYKSSQKLTLQSTGGATFIIGKGQKMTIKTSEPSDDINQVQIATGKAKTVTTIDSKAINLIDISSL